MTDITKAATNMQRPLYRKHLFLLIRFNHYLCYAVAFVSDESFLEVFCAVFTVV